MGTCAHNGQAIGVAAALCLRDSLTPRDLLAPDLMRELQRRLLRKGQFIPGVALHDPANLANHAKWTASSQLLLGELPPGSGRLELQESWAMMIPVSPGPMPAVEFLLDIKEETELVVELRVSSKPDNHTPDVTLATRSIPLGTGVAVPVTLEFGTVIDVPRYAFVCLLANSAITSHLSDQRVTGVLAVSQKYNRAVAKSPRQEPPPGSGIESFEFWLPQRRPAGRNLACRITPPLAAFGPEKLRNGLARPTCQPNAWLSSLEDAEPTLTLDWAEEVQISRMEFGFDADFDNPLENVLIRNPETASPFCVSSLKIKDGEGNQLAEMHGNHLGTVSIDLPAAARTSRLVLEFSKPSSDMPVALFELRCYP